MSNVLNISDLHSLISGSRRVDIDDSPRSETATSRILSRLTLVHPDPQRGLDVETFAVPTEISEKLIIPESTTVSYYEPCKDYFAIGQLKLDTLGNISISINPYSNGTLLYSFHSHNYSLIPDHHKRLIESKIDEIISCMRMFNPRISRDNITVHDARILVEKLKISLFRNFSWIELSFNIQTERIILNFEFVSSYEDDEYTDRNYYLRVIKYEDCNSIPECIISTVSEYLSDLDKPHLSLFTQEEYENFEEYFDEYASRFDIGFRSYLDSGIISLALYDIGTAEYPILEILENEMNPSESSNRVLSLISSSLIKDKTKAKEVEKAKKEKILFDTIEERFRYVLDSAQDVKEIKSPPLLKKLEEAHSSAYLSREEVVAFAESNINEIIEKYKKDSAIYSRKPMRDSIRNIKSLPQVQLITYF